MNIRTCATKLLRQFQSDMAFNKDEALKFVHNVFRLTKITGKHGMLGFDKVFSKLC